MSVVYFLLLVGVIVVIHELGHFTAAKLLDFKVLRFSIGFGRPLFRISGKETEYQIALIPLGGYVRILGEDAGDDVPVADIGRSFQARPLWQRLIVVFAGPAANLVLPVFIYFILFAGHSELPAATVGDILPGQPALVAGIRPGDRVLAIDGESVRYWEDLEEEIQQNIGRELRLTLRRGNREFDKYIVPVEEIVRSRDGQATQQGFIGITHAPFLPQIGVIDPRSPAARAGLATGDLIVSVDGDVVNNWTELRPKLDRGARRASIVYLRGQPVPGLAQAKLYEAHFADLVPAPRFHHDTGTAVSGAAANETTGLATLPGEHDFYTGLEPAEMFVARVDPGSPADQAGLRPGDLITQLDDESVEHWITLDKRLQSRPERTFVITWQRASGDRVDSMSAHLTQVRLAQVDEFGHAGERLVFGAHSEFERGRGDYTPIQGRFLYAGRRAVRRTRETVSAMVAGFWSILGGQAPSDSVGGPLMMYRVASVSGHKGWDSFLLILALISVNLGLINLLPVPVLDGGHLLMFAVEAVSRRPLSQKVRERIHYAGLAVVGLITILALRNDVVRYIIH